MAYVALHGTLEIAVDDEAIKKNPAKDRVGRQSVARDVGAGVAGARLDYPAGATAVELREHADHG